MRRRPLDDDAADRLLDGRTGPGDAPPGLGAVAGLVQAAHLQVAATSEVVDLSPVAAMAAAVRDGDAATQIPQRKPMLAKLLTAKVALVGGVALFGATAAAASAGTLPAPAQSAVSGTLQKVGVDVPSKASRAKVKAGNPKSDHGHCRAFLNGPGDDAPGEAGGAPTTTVAGAPSGKYAAPPFARLIEAHGGLEATRAYCEGVVAAKHPKEKEKGTTTTSSAPAGPTTSTPDKEGKPPKEDGPGRTGEPGDPGKPKDPGARPGDPGRPSDRPGKPEGGHGRGKDKDRSTSTTATSTTATSTTEAPAGGERRAEGGRRP